MFSSGPKYQKLVTNLRLAISRLKLLEKKKSEMAVKSRKEIADYIKNGKEDRARIRVEHIIREDYMVEGLEIVEMYCDLLLARMGVLQTSKILEDGLEEPIASIIWATPRIQGDVQELVVVTEQLALKYGKEFVMNCKANNLHNVNEKLVHKLGIHAPPRVLVEKYMEEIAKSFNIPYVSPVETESPNLIFGNDDDDFGNSRGGGGGGMPAGKVKPSADLLNFAPFNMGSEVRPPQDIGFTINPNSMPPQYMSYPAQQPSQAVPPFPMLGPNEVFADDFPCLPPVPNDSVRGKSEATQGDQVNFDDLSKRFQELKKKH